MKVYDKALPSPLTVEETKNMGEHITIATSAACLMKNIDDDHDIDPVDI